MQDHLIVLRRNLEIVLGLPCSVHGRRIWQILFSLSFSFTFLMSNHRLVVGGISWIGFVET